MLILLQILEDGTLTDSSGKRINFKNTILIMTSNLTSAHNSRSHKIIGFGEEASKATDPRRLDALTGFFSPEFLNRIDEIIIFNELTESHLSEIASKLLSELSNRARENGIILQISPLVAPLLAKRAVTERLGARPLRREIISDIESPLAEFILKNSPITGPINICVEDHAIRIEKEKALV